MLNLPFSAYFGPTVSYLTHLAIPPTGYSFVVLKSSNRFLSVGKKIGKEGWAKLGLAFLFLAIHLALYTAVTQR